MAKISAIPSTGATHGPIAPYIPERPQTQFQRVLKDGARKVYPLPFALGELHAPRLLVILEGQWGAITFYHACGWFDRSRTPSLTLVLGMRGTQSTEVFLSLYGSILRQHTPKVLLIGDNDEAGRTWVEPRRREGKLPKPCFLDRIKATGCSVSSAFISRSAGTGKDFNDWYRCRAPGPQEMRDWLSSLIG